MTAQLSGRTLRTLLTELELLSNDETQVLTFLRNQDGTIVIRTRLPHEDYWSSSGARFEISEKDARTLGMLLKSEDVSYNRSTIEEISSTHLKREKPAEILEKELREKIGDCSELDIERAKATRIAEEKDLLKLQNSRDHALDKHIGQTVDGCVECENRIRPGYGDGSLREQDDEPVSPDAPVSDDSQPEDLPY
jgi:hypothetical protein